MIKFRFFRPTFQRWAFLAVLAVAGLVIAPASSEAAPISYLYTGSVTSVDPILAADIPLGSLATILLTVDPAVNIYLGFAGTYSPNAGGYWYDAVLDFTGREYFIHGAFEVNADVNDVQLPGLVEVVELNASGPQLPGFTSLGGFPSVNCAPFCRFDFSTSDPTSPALPLFQSVNFPLLFNAGDCIPVGSACFSVLSKVRISGSVTPEPGTLMLFASGVVGIASRLRKRRRRQEA